MINTFSKLFPNKKPLIGMIHLPLLPGYQGYLGKKYVIKKALKDLNTLELAGFDGVLVENHEGLPGFVGASDKIKEVFKDVVKEIMVHSKVPVGMEIIYDMPATVDVAANIECDFVRLDVFADSVKTRWGIVPQSYRIVNKILNSYSKKPLLFVDVHVKHAKLLTKKNLEESIKVSLKHGANGIIVTGNWTGIEPEINDLKVACKYIKEAVPVIVGSGLSVLNAEKLLLFSDAAIVGTSIKTGKHIDFKKANDLVEAVKKNKII